MAHYFRTPGAKVTYNSYETRDYVSRKARISRGLFLTPTRRDRVGKGWRFWFASLRGPASDRGNWKVDVARVEDGGGDGDGGTGGDGTGGDGGGGSTLPACPPTGTALTYRHAAHLALRYTFKDPPGGFVADFYYGSGTLTEAGIRAFFAGQYPRINPDDGYFFLSSTEFLTADGGTYYEGGWGWQGPEDGISLTFDYGFITTSASASPSGSRYENLTDYLEPPWAITDVSGGGYNFSAPGGLPDPYCDDGSSPPPPPPDDGGGGTLPEGYLPGAGPWAYTCTCPDLTGVENPYQVATAPTHRKARSWGQIRPESPCKHIAAAAKALGDQKSLVMWVRMFRGDSPGSEFSNSPTVVLDRTYENLRREHEAAFRRTVRAMGRARSAANRQKRAERSALRLSERLGRVHRIDDKGKTISSNVMGRFGQPLHIANSPALERIRRGTSQTYDQGNRAIYTTPERAPRQPLVMPTRDQMASDPRFWSPSDVAYQIGYEARSLVRPNYAPTAATLLVGGTGPVLGSRNNRSIRIPNPDQSPGAQDSILIPGTRANSRRYGVSLR